jgi:hypothetical protein
MIALSDSDRAASRSETRVKTDLHDRLLRASYWHFGAGANYALTESLDLSFNYVTYLRG